ncbi:TPA: tail fiber assembly protein, partial [Citrobacter freundii]|nr:tail fiber assembly protein [Citrobacter freundii]
MKYKYCPETNMFYPYALHDEYSATGAWPENGHDAVEAIFAEFTSQPPEGKTRIAGPDGLPAWGDIPPHTPEQTQQLAMHKKSILLAEASAVIAPLLDAKDGGYIDDNDIPVLVAWQKYRYALTKVNPDKPVWPV